MIVKQYQGKTEEEAIAKAKKELGENVTIMGVKKVRRGFFGFLRPKIVELNAAIEEEQERPMTRQSLPPLKPVRPANPAKMPNPQIIPEPAGPVKEEKTEKSEKTDSGIEAKLESLHSLIEQQLVKENDREIKSSSNTEDSDVEFMKLIYNTLIDNEVDEKYVNELLDEVERVKSQKASIDSVLSIIYQKMILMFGQPSIITPAQSGCRLIFFVGPTGVGKTTTIAKIASKLSVNDKKKVVLLTADTYRIAATEQLRTYANIMDTPFRVIYDADEMAAAVQDFRDADYILVDTAGHSHTNEEQRAGMLEKINCVDETIEKEVFLVVSATTKYRDLLSIADAYKQLSDYRLIFTKLDETTTLGNLFNLRMHTGADMSYVTCGQDVPDDIEVFSPQSTVKQLLGGR
ncbi:MAG: flagellar biosynthesis protein FlhF [Lachnospiraceae bacterium]|nr:flagellar biosynthesis protein FlhF [Lachnospiraceae bacterium]